MRNARRGLYGSLRLETLETRLALAADVTFGDWNFGDWHNESTAGDVDADGYVSPLDALHVINTLNRFQGGMVSEVQQRWHDHDSNATEVVEGFLPDVDGDGSVSPLDALLAINRLTLQQSSDMSSTVAVIPDGQGRPESVRYVAADGRSQEVSVRGEDVNIIWSGLDVVMTRADNVPRVIAKPGIGILEGEDVEIDGALDTQAIVTRYLDDGGEVIERYLCMPIFMPEQTLPDNDARIPIVGFEETMGALVSRQATLPDGSIIEETYEESTRQNLLSVTATLPTGETASALIPQPSSEFIPALVATDLFFVLNAGERTDKPYTLWDLISKVEELGGTPESNTGWLISFINESP